MLMFLFFYMFFEHKKSNILRLFDFSIIDLPKKTWEKKHMEIKTKELVSSSSVSVGDNKNENYIKLFTDVTSFVLNNQYLVS